MLRPILTVAALAAATAFVGIPPAHAAATCAGHKVTIHGTSKSETINGTNHADVIDAGAGDDVVNGRGGNDIICGGDGADDLRGNAGNDKLYGGLDARRSEKFYSDSCSDNPGGYCLITWLEGDTLRGNSGNDLLVPGWDTRDSHTQGGGSPFPPFVNQFATDPTNSFDRIQWDTSTTPVTINLTKLTATGEGKDTIVASGRYDVLTTPYDDTVVGSDGPDYIQTGTGSDVVHARGGDDYVGLDNASSTYRDADVAYGGPGSDFLSAGTGTDTLYGDEGDDQLLDRGTPKADKLYGGAGDDVLSDVLVPLAGQVDDGGGDAGDVFWPELSVGGMATWDMVSGTMHFTEPSATTVSAPGFHTFRDLEHYTTTWHITGTDQADTVAVGGTFDGLGGDDNYSGSSGADTFNGGSGSDRYQADSTHDNTCTSVELDPQTFCATNSP